MPINQPREIIARTLCRSSECEGGDSAYGPAPNEALEEADRILAALAANQLAVVGTSDKTAWLIEEVWSGYTHYVHRGFDAKLWGEACRRHNERRRVGLPSEIDVAFITKDVNLAMRFETEAEASTWLRKQPRFINHSDQFQPREHVWVSPSPLSTGDRR